MCLRFQKFVYLNYSIGLRVIPKILSSVDPGNQILTGNILAEADGNSRINPDPSAKWLGDSLQKIVTFTVVRNLVLDVLPLTAVDFSRIRN